ncbi:amidoligase family protein [Roseivivax sp. CAU 1761]
MPRLEDLPEAHKADGTPRRVGIEIEFGGLTEDHTAELARTLFGGEIRPRDDLGLVLTDSRIGDVEIYLDSQYLHEPEGRIGRGVLSVARHVVPVEIVTAPVTPAEIAEIDTLIEAMRQEGATGTSAGLFLGFGVHFNPEVVAMEPAAILPVFETYAFCEDALREEMEIDLARRALPFVDPYPRKLLDGLAEAPPATLDDLAALYLERAPSRNHGLDMLCLLAQHDADRVAARIGSPLVTSRPTFHYRLPDCRIDEPDWSLTREWNRWVRLERLAQDAGLRAHLRDAWRDHRRSFTATRRDWARATRDIVSVHS